MNGSLKQDLSQQAEFANMLMIHLLFEEKPQLLDHGIVRQAAEDTFGDIEDVSNDNKLLTFAVKKYTAHFQDGDIPPLVLLAQGIDFDSGNISELERSQFWDMKNGEEVIDRCKYSVMISDMMSGAAMDYKERCEMVMDWLECILELYPSCKAVWTPTGSKLIDPDSLKHLNLPRDQRFIYTCVNARFFNVEGSSGEYVVDTLGMYAIGLPDTQLHFKVLEPGTVTNYAYNICIYNYDENAPIASGETMDGLDSEGNFSRDEQWTCQYENALIQPARTVLDIAAAGYAAGRR